MIISEVVTLFFYIISIAFLPAYFGESYAYMFCYFRPFKHGPDLSFVVTYTFAWKVAAIVGISALPLYIFKLVKRKVAPAASSKLL